MLPGVRLPAGPRSRPPPRPCPPAAALLHKAPGACISRSGVRQPQEERGSEQGPRPPGCTLGGTHDLSPSPSGASHEWGHGAAGASPEQGGVTPGSVTDPIPSLPLLERPKKEEFNPPQLERRGEAAKGPPGQ